MDYRKQLQAIQGQVSKQMENYKPNDFGVIPNADYTVRTRAVIEMTKTPPPRLRVAWGFTVAEGEYEGRQVWDGTVIQDNETGLNICRGRVEAFGFEWPEDISRLADICEAITAASPLTSIAYKTVEKDGYTNSRIRIKEVLESVEIPDQQPADDAQPEQAPEPDETTEDLDAAAKLALLDFCAAQGIDGVTDDLSTADIITALKDNKFTFNRAELTPEEAELLTSLDAAELIIEPEPPKAKKAITKAAPAPLTRTTAPVAAKTTRVQPKPLARTTAPTKKR